MNPKQIILLVVLYIAASAGSYGAFSMFGSETGGLTTTSGGGLAKLISPIVPKSAGGLAIDQNLPKTEVCPLNGAKFTVPEREAWEKRRPLAVMIENHMDARPQSGLSKADVVYEAIAEGGITRYMAVFLCAAQASDVIVAPVRSARQYFMEWASDYNFPLYVHVGGANGTDTDPKVRALENLTAWGWTNYNDMNQFSIGYPVFVRNYNRVPGKDLATEHTMESSTQRLWEYAKTKRGLTNLDEDGKDWMSAFTKWTFASGDAAVGERGTSQKVSYEFWEGFTQFAVTWDYDSATNSYKRTLAGVADTDINTSQQLAAKNVIVLFTKELGPLDVHKHMYYQTTGFGNALWFANGKQQDITWTKKDVKSRLTFSDKKGKPIQLVPGQVWISVVAEKTPVQVQ